MNYLGEFRDKVILYDGMLCETGGNFGKSGEIYYIGDCLKVAQQYLLADGKKDELLSIMDQIIKEYEKDTKWIYMNLEMSFLEQLRSEVMLL